MLKGLARFESFAEKLVEGTLQRLGGRRLEPVEIARWLTRAMEDHQTISAGKIFVPNVYRVGLHPETFQQFVSFKEPLEQELASYLVEEAERNGFNFVGRPHVTLTAETGVPRGRLRVSTALAGGGPRHVDDIGVTQAIRAEQVQAEARRHASAEQLQLVIDERTIPLSQPPINIGRSLDNDVIIQAPSVSRRHAQIVFRHGRWLLRDLNSTYGTRVNGHSIEESILRAGDVITLGDVTARVEAIPASDDQEASGQKQ